MTRAMRRPFVRRFKYGSSEERRRLFTLAMMVASDLTEGRLFFYISLTVYLSIILVINQLNAKILIL